MSIKSLFEYAITFSEEYGVACFLVLLGMFFIIVWTISAIESRKEKAEKEKLVTNKSALKMIALVSIPFFVWLFIAEINPAYLGYGYSTGNMEIVVHDDDALWTTDYYTQSGGGLGSSVIYRIQGINLNNGSKQFKKLISNPYHIVGNYHQMVWIKTEVAEDKFELSGIHILTDQTIKTITKETLTNDLPELSNGVYNFEYNSKTDLLDITSKDGLKISIDPENNTKVDSPIKKEVRSRIDKYSIRDSKNNTIITLIRDGERETLRDENKKALLGNLFFLKGQFITLDTITQAIYTFSYETLEKKNFLIRCVSINGELIWEANQDKLDVADFFVPEPNFETSFLYKDNLIVGVNGFVFSLNKKNGQLNWLTRI